MATALDKMRQAVAVRMRHSVPQQETLRYVEPAMLVDVRRSLIGFHTYKWVLILFAFAAVYFGFLASDRFASNAEVYVKSTEASSGGSGLALLNISSPERQDAFFMEKYFQSMDLLMLLDAKLDLRAHYSDPSWDFISRLDKDATKEEFLDYFRSRVGVSLSPDSGIMHIQVQAYTPEFAKALADELLAAGDAFINKVSQDIASSDMEFVRTEVLRAQGEMQRAQDRIAAFQRENKLLSPQASGETLQAVVNELEVELSRAQAEEKRLSAYLNDAAPDLVAVRGRIAAMLAQLAQEKEKVAAADDDAINAISLSFRRLELELSLASELYSSALSALEKTRLEAFRKIKHLVVVESPAVPEDASYPRRIYNLATIFIVLTLLYGIITMVIATVREHRDV